jgi:predicted RecB family nuclease
MTAPIVLTAQTLRHLATCPRRVWLDAHGDRAAREVPPPSAIYRMTRGIQHEEAVNRAVSPQVESVPVADWPDALAQTRRLMQEGAPAILGACLEAPLDVPGLDGRPVVLRGVVDRLLLVERRASLIRSQTRFVYAPIEIKQYARISDADRAQLDCYGWLLAQVQGVEPPAAEFWLAQDAASYPARRERHTLDLDGISERLTAAARLAAGVDPEPPVAILPHCRECPWYSACKGQAQTRFHVSVLDVRSATLRHLLAEGITSVDQVAAMSEDELLRFKDIGRVTAPRIRAQAHAYLENRAVCCAPLPDVLRRSPWHFDIETHPQTNQIWSIGWGRGLDDLHMVVVVEALRRVDALTLPTGQTVMLAPDTDSAWRVFAEGVSGDAEPVLHWTGFDSGVMRATAPRDVVAALDRRLGDLHADFKRSVAIPARGTSLKTVAAHFGFAWSAYADWFAALRDYERWLATDDVRALERAAAYQLDDVRAMVIVWGWLVAQASDGVPLAGDAG